MKMMYCAMLICIAIFAVFPRGYAGNSASPIQTNKDTICAELEHVLKSEFSLWYPLSQDTAYGGFFSDIRYDWKLEGKQDKMVVTQARHVWSTATGSLFYRKDTVLRNISAYGVRFLKDVLWDKKYGGFYNLVTRNGRPIAENGQVLKQAYGNAFAIYGLAAYFRASGDSSALKLAQKTFRWLERHSYDSKNGGYYQYLSRKGAPLTEGIVQLPPKNRPAQGTLRIPPKDQNSTIHLLECFTELYRVWPDSLLRERLVSLLYLVRDTITTPRGYMTLFFSRDWKAVSFRDSSVAVRTRNFEFDHVSFGHDVETGYLMLEAVDALGWKHDTVTLRVAKKMIDHGLTYGMDQIHGGIYDGGYYEKGASKPTIVKNTKEWWEQVEAMNAFLMMSDLFPNDPHEYYKQFCLQWNYCKKYVIDPVYGGWYWGGIDIVPDVAKAPKGSIWKCNYHTSRALENCIDRLGKERVHGK
jgi:mannobiose 2-epimerase